MVHHKLVIVLRFTISLATPMLDAQNDINQVPSGTTATGSVLTNDSVSDNSAITVTSATYLNALQE